MFHKKKTETLSIREFMAGNHKRKIASPITYVMSLFFPVITPKSFFPVHDVGFALFLVGCVTITGSALLQYLIAQSGRRGISDAISAISGIVFPVIGYGAIVWFIFTL